MPGRKRSRAASVGARELRRASVRNVSGSSVKQVQEVIDTRYFHNQDGSAPAKVASKVHLSVDLAAKIQTSLAQASSENNGVAVGNGLLRSGAILLPTGHPDQHSLERARFEEMTEYSPYRSETRTKSHLAAQKAARDRLDRLKTPVERAKTRIKAVVSEMLKIKAADKEEEGKERNHLNPEKNLRARNRIIPAQIHRKMLGTFDEPMFDLIQDWTEDMSNLRETYGTTDARSALSAKALEDKPIPSYEEAVAQQGNAPSFYGVKRLPEPARLPSSFAPKQQDKGESHEQQNSKHREAQRNTTKCTKDVKRHDAADCFITPPKVEWRREPKQAVLQRAYSYMLGNIKIREASDDPSRRVTVSKEMSGNLRKLIKENIGAGFWKDQVSSKLAQPFDITAYCKDREAMLFSTDSAPGLEEKVLLGPPELERTSDFVRLDPRKTNSDGQLAKTEPLVKDPLQRKSVRTAPRAERWEFCFSDEAHEAATRITRTWSRRHRRRAKACALIQKIARGMVYRGRVAAYRADKVAAVCVIQAAMRGRIGRRLLTYLRMARSYGLSIPDLKSWELCRIPGNICIRMAHKRADDAKRRHDEWVGRLLTNIQRMHRGWLGRRYAAHCRHIRVHETKAALAMQSAFRGRRARAEIWPVRDAVRRGVARMQANLRRNLEQRRYRKTMAFRHAMALLIERVYRGHLGRLAAEHARLVRASATLINQAARGHRARRMIQQWKIARKRAEKRRLQVENNMLADVLVENRPKVRAYLRTKPGRIELKRELALAKSRRAAFGKLRKTMAPRQLEKSRAIEAFEVFDFDGSGEIDASEFRSALAELCIPLTKRQAELALETMDRDHDGTITKDEFMFWYLEKLGPSKIVNGERRKQSRKKKQNVLDSLSSFEDSSLTNESRAINGSWTENSSFVPYSRPVVEKKNPSRKELVLSKIEGKKFAAQRKLDQSIAAIIKAKLKVGKALRDITGLTDRHAAKRVIYAARAEIAKEEFCDDYRKSHPHDRWYHEFELPRHIARNRRVSLLANGHLD